MGMKKVFDLVYSGEKYTDRNGDEKTRFVNVGAVFERDDGTQCLKIETLPVGFSGWLNFFEPREREEKPQQQRAQDRNTQLDQRGGQQRSDPYTGKPRDAAPQNNNFDDDDIPF